MLAVWVKVRIKPDQRQRFLDAIEVDALGSEKDEPGCLRFNVLQDANDENTYYFYEVYKDQAALEAHRAMPHYKVWPRRGATLGRRLRRGQGVAAPSGGVRVGGLALARWYNPADLTSASVQLGTLGTSRA